MFKDVVIVSATRTAIGSFGGSLKDVSCVDLGATVIKESILQAKIAPEKVEEVVLGCVGQHGWSPFLARLAALKAGCSIESTGQTVNRLCASGLQAVVTAAMLIDRDDAKVCIAGGVENMSGYPYHSYNMRWGKKMGNAELIDSLSVALGEPVAGDEGNNIHIANTAENVAQKYQITRQEADEYALNSQLKALTAIAEDRFVDEIVAIEVPEGRATRCFKVDEYPRSTSLEKLGKLRPILGKDGVITAGNASGINDGAAAMLITNTKTATDNGCNVGWKIIDYAVAGVEPEYMGMGPVLATNKLLAKVGKTVDEIDLWEVNEAFAVQALACIRELGIPEDKVNVNGSGISLGHPIGATGAIISVKLLHEMKRRDAKYGIATLCIGGGQGLSVLYENV